MRPFLVDNDIRKRVTEVIAYATEHFYTMDDLLDLKNKAKTIPGDIEHYVVYIPVGYGVAYTREEQPPGMCHHLSMSVETPGKMPDPAVVIETCKLFGMSGELENCHLSLEEFAPGHHCINVQELVK